jgi:hypothetical protein
MLDNGVSGCEDGGLVGIGASEATCIVLSDDV